MQVLAYLEAFAAFYDLQPHIAYGRRVLRALPLPQEPLSDSSACGPHWRVTTCATSGPDQVHGYAMLGTSHDPLYSRCGRW